MPITFSGPVPIKYLDLGRGDPSLLLMPGWCADRGMFARLQGPLSKHQRVLALDWRGHGASAPAVGDFGEHGLVEDARAVLHEAAPQSIVPVAVAHAGWVAIDLRRRLGERVAGIVLVDWIVGEPPPAFRATLEDLQFRARQHGTVEALLTSWAAGSSDPELLGLLERMRGQDARMWARAGREIAASYDRMGSPLQALATFSPPVPTLHVYAQPADDAYLAMQRAFAVSHPWFHVERIAAATHFPHLEAPEATSDAIERFIASLSSPAAAPGPQRAGRAAA